MSTASNRAGNRARFFLCTLGAGLLAACIPHPGGQCAADTDCGYGLSCQAGLCETPPPRACTPACSAGLHCNDGSCALDAAPIVTWSSPADGTAAANGAVSIALSISTPAIDVAASIHLAALNSAGVSPLDIPLARSADGLYRGLVDASALAERDWSMTPSIAAAGAEWGGPSRRLRIDRTGPSIELYLPTSPSGFFLRTDTVEIRARIADDGAGLDDTTPVAVAQGMSNIAGTRLSAQEWSFQVPLAAPAFSAASGPLSLGVSASDLLGNASIANGSVPVTRALWSRSIGSALPIRSSPALDAHHLFVGTDSGDLVALDRASGAVVWSRSLSGPVSASPARGASALYIASEGGDFRALDPDTGAVLWSCIDLPQGLSFLSSPAIAQVTGLAPGGAALETIALANSGSITLGTSAISGGLFLLEGTVGFQKPGGARSCYLVANASGGRSSPAVDLDGTIYAGGDDSRAHALRIDTDANGGMTLDETWTVLTADDVSASPALGAGGIAFGDESGKLFWLASDGTPLSATRALADKLLASPLVAFNTLFALDRSGTLTPFATGAASPIDSAVQPMFGIATISGASNVQATAAVGADGTIYIAADRALYAFAPSGAQLWSTPLPGAATASSPTLGCDGTLYLGDSSGDLTAIATDSHGLAPGWSKFHHDARNTGNAGLGVCE